METQRWYNDGLRFGCRQCGGCCGGAPGYVWTTDSEIVAMAKELGISRTQFEMSFVRLIFGRKKSLTERPNGDCVLLNPETKKCMVYDTRPVQCRTWPFWEQNLDKPSSWKRTAKGCPGCNNPQGKLYTLEEIESERARTF
ncbi:MAG: YkgJ family cysteine cluster protein [Thermoguttaceae bacterium]|nr:YkgJ family cysteine cluster protein [Thermoguttaceae bacterium]